MSRRLFCRDHPESSREVPCRIDPIELCEYIQTARHRTRELDEPVGRGNGGIGVGWGGHEVMVYQKS